MAPKCGGKERDKMYTTITHPVAWDPNFVCALRKRNHKDRRYSLPRNMSLALKKKRREVDL